MAPLKVSKHALQDAHAQEAANAGHQFQLIDWLGEEVIAAALDGAFKVADFVKRGDHDDDGVAEVWVLLDLLADFKA